jgi:hypothetical protein
MDEVEIEFRSRAASCDDRAGHGEFHAELGVEAVLEAVVASDGVDVRTHVPRGRVDLGLRRDCGVGLAVSISSGRASVLFLFPKGMFL